MPIKNLTDNVVPAFPNLGRLRKGAAKAQDGKAPGQELHHFRFTSDRPELVTAFCDLYGPEPQLLHVYLPYADIDRDFSAWREQWSAGGLVHRCDGDQMVIWRTPDGKFSQQAKDCPYCHGEKQRTRQDPGCAAVGRLTVILPELIKAGHVGYVTMETHSLHDIRNIYATLLAVMDARNGNPKGLQGIQFILRRVPEMISTPGDEGKRVRRQKWLVKIEPAQDWVSLQLEAARQMALAAPGESPALMQAQGRVIDGRTGEVLDEPEAEDDDEQPEQMQPEPPQPEPTHPALPETFTPPGDRPYPADYLALYLGTLADEGKHEIAPENEIKRAWNALALLLPEASREQRLAVMAYLTGTSDAHTLTLGWTAAIIEWVNPTKDRETNAWVPDLTSVAEARAVLAAAQAEAEKAA